VILTKLIGKVLLKLRFQPKLNQHTDFLFDMGAKRFANVLQIVVTHDHWSMKGRFENIFRSIASEYEKNPINITHAIGR